MTKSDARQCFLAMGEMVMTTIVMVLVMVATILSLINGEGIIDRDEIVEEMPE